MREIQSVHHSKFLYLMLWFGIMKARRGIITVVVVAQLLDCQQDRRMAPWIKAASGKSFATIGTIVFTSVALTVFFGDVERAIQDSAAKPIPGSNLKHRKSGNW